MVQVVVEISTRHGEISVIAGHTDLFECASSVVKRSLTAIVQNFSLRRDSQGIAKISLTAGIRRRYHLAAYKEQTHKQAVSPREKHLYERYLLKVLSINFEFSAVFSVQMVVIVVLQNNEFCYWLV